MKGEYLEEIFEQAKKNLEKIFNVRYQYGFSNFLTEQKQIKMCICWFLLTNIDLPYKYTITRIAELFNTSTDKILAYLELHKEEYNSLEQYRENYDKFIDSMYSVMVKLGMENERYIPGVKQEYHYLFDEMCGILEDSHERKDIAETITFFKLFCLNEKTKLLSECKYNNKQHWLFYFAKYHHSVYVVSQDNEWITNFTNHWTFYEAMLKEEAGYRIDIIVNDKINYKDDTLFN
jgi:hypothetical protein